MIRPPADLPPYLKSLYGMPLLTKEQEQYLFRRMNFRLYQAKKLQDQIDRPSPARAISIGWMRIWRTRRRSNVS